MTTPDPLELLPRPWRIVREAGQDVIRCATGASVFWHPVVKAHVIEAVNTYAGREPHIVEYAMRLIDDAVRGLPDDTDDRVLGHLALATATLRGILPERSQDGAA